MTTNVTSQQLKIALLLGSLKGAGAEKTLLTLAETFASKGHQVLLLTLNDYSDYQTTNNIERRTLDGKNRREQQKSLKEITRQFSTLLFITSKPDYYDHGVATLRLCSVHITPTAWLTNKKERPIKHFFQVQKLKSRYRNKHLIALSDGIRHDLIENLGCKAENINVIPNPYDFDEIFQMASSQKAIPEYEYIIYVASFIDRKRHSDLLNAFAKLKNQKIRLLLVGKGERESELREQAKRLDISERVVFHGWDSNPYRLIRNSRLSILASEAEGLPRVVVESLILNTPVVSTDCPSGPNEVLTGELSRFLVPVGNINGMAKAMEEALTDYPDIRTLDMSRFSASSVADQYIAMAKSKISI